MNLPNINNDNGVMTVNTGLDESFRQILAITYADSMTNMVNVKHTLFSDSLSVIYSTDQTSKVLCMFDISAETE